MADDLFRAIRPKFDDIAVFIADIHRCVFALFGHPCAVEALQRVLFAFEALDLLLGNHVTPLWRGLGRLKPFQTASICIHSAFSTEVSVCGCAATWAAWAFSAASASASMRFFSVRYWLIWCTNSCVPWWVSGADFGRGAGFPCRIGSGHRVLG